eukprot:gnl/Trimastix_PCT/2209.p1 GENE.gnl/Trimastix_PCT/2209~~gnl/Trimastix_PCT/2209.p1  ORF type:complete len:403 (+),score=120.07 gnl/Trimastix_PCT/2209:504-1712(+)
MSQGIFAGLDKEESMPVWMSHGDQVTRLPGGFRVDATSASCATAAVSDPTRRIYGVQFHPEVTHTAIGKQLLRNYVCTICACRATWSMGCFLQQAVRAIQAEVGPSAHVIGGISGGVDSTVGALLLHRAIGDRFHGILVDNGLLRHDEARHVMTRLALHGIALHLVDASAEFLAALAGVSDPERKRKAIGHKFIEVFEREAHQFSEAAYLFQGTLYPDVIESVSVKGPSQTIKSHHNVGGLLDCMHLKLLEPLRELFKDEVRALGLELGLDRASVYRHPFPGPGLGIRVMGCVEESQLDLLRRADSIYMEELREAGVYGEISQAGCILLPVRTVGVMGDCRTYEQTLALRAVVTTDFMTAECYPMEYSLLRKISNRIINEVRGVNRVVYDISSKPPATIEWE